MDYKVMIEKNINLLKAIGFFFVALIFVLSAVFLSSYITNYAKGNQPKVAQQQASFTAITCPRDSESYKIAKADKNVVLLEDKQSYGSNGGFVKTYNVSIQRSGLSSEIACGYLFFSMSDGKNPINEQYENFYMIPESQQFGGHIIPQSYNTISDVSANGKTDVLLPLDDIAYDGTGRQNFKQANWVALLNVSNTVNFTIALNTQNQMGRINSVEIAYKCWNPITGKQTEDCNLSAK